MLQTRLAAPAIALAAAAAAFVLVWRRGWPLARFAVEGASMEPSYCEGDRVVVYRWAYRNQHPAAGDAVVLRDPERPGRWIIKRVAFDAARQGGVFVLGDNVAGSRDSRVFGDVTAASIMGRVVMRY